MVIVSYEPAFKKKVRKIKDASLRERVKKQIRKIVLSPGIGKPMKYARKGTREVYVPPFRLSYQYLDKEDKIILLELYHKDGQ